MNGQRIDRRRVLQFAAHLPKIVGIEALRAAEVGRAYRDGKERYANHETALMRPAAYTWDNAMIEGRRRLALLEHSLDPSTFRRLEAIGVAPGWRCLDVGAGGGTVCEWLCRRVGPTGRVTAMDLDARFLRALDYANLDVREENVVDADLPSGTFDLVHTRWTLMHIPERERVLQKFADCLAPGGTLFLEEPDSISVRTLDRTGFLTAVVARVRDRPATRIGSGLGPRPAVQDGVARARQRARRGRDAILSRRLGARRVLADQLGARARHGRRVRRRRHAVGPRAG